MTRSRAVAVALASLLALASCGGHGAVNLPARPRVAPEAAEPGLAPCPADIASLVGGDSSCLSSVRRDATAVLTPGARGAHLTLLTARRGSTLALDVDGLIARRLLAWSPDGGALAVVGRSTRGVPATGQEGDPRLSLPARSETDQDQVFFVEAATGLARQAAPLRGAPCRLLWSSDSRHLAVLTTEGSFSSDAPCDTGEAFILARDDRFRVELTAGAPATAMAWSPDGTRLALATGGTRLRVFDASGRETAAWQVVLPGDASAGGGIHSLAWPSPGRMLLATGSGSTTYWFEADAPQADTR